jgi:hypothetical protein
VAPIMPQKQAAAIRYDARVRFLDADQALR